MQKSLLNTLSLKLIKLINFIVHSLNKFNFNLVYHFNIHYYPLHSYLVTVVLILQVILSLFFFFVCLNGNAFLVTNLNIFSEQEYLNFLDNNSSNNSPQTDHQNTPNQGEPNSQAPGQPNGENNGPAPGQANQENNSSEDNDSALGSEDSNSLNYMGPCDCCDQAQNHEGHCWCVSNCRPEVVVNYEDRQPSNCCGGCGSLYYNHLCSHCTCTYCSNCYNTRRN